MNESYFCILRHKNKGKHSQHFKLLFFKLDLHFVTSNQIPTYRKPNLPLKSSIYLVFLPLEMQGRLKQTKLYQEFFYFVWKEATRKPSKVATAKILFSSVYIICTTLLWWMFFILCDTWKTSLFITVYRYSEIILTAMLLLSLKTMFWRKSVFYALSPQ